MTVTGPVAIAERVSIRNSPSRASFKEASARCSCRAVRAARTTSSSCPVGIPKTAINSPPAAVEGEHQLATEALAEGILCDQQLELTNELGARAESQLRVHQVLKRGGTQLLQAPDHGRGERLEGKVRKRRAAPELERL